MYVLEGLSESPECLRVGSPRYLTSYFRSDVSLLFLLPTVVRGPPTDGGERKFHLQLSSVVVRDKTYY